MAGRAQKRTLVLLNGGADILRVHRAGQGGSAQVRGCAAFALRRHFPRGFHRFCRRFGPGGRDFLGALGGLLLDLLDKIK